MWHSSFLPSTTTWCPTPTMRYNKPNHLQMPTAAHEPKRPLMDRNDHAESRCHVTDGDMATKQRTTTLVIVCHSCLVSHVILFQLPSLTTRRQTMTSVVIRWHVTTMAHEMTTQVDDTETTWQEFGTMRVHSRFVVEVTFLSYNHCDTSSNRALVNPVNEA